MSINLQIVPYLPLQRNFPNDSPQELGVELDKAYVDIAQRVNERTIGLYAINYQTVTGNRWFLAGQPKRQQTLRQVYIFTTTASIPHGINFTKISRFTLTYGNFTDSTNWYGLISGSNVAIAGQISFYLTPTNIVFLVGAGAPAITNGSIVLEWLSQL